MPRQEARKRLRNTACLAKIQISFYCCSISSSKKTRHNTEKQAKNPTKHHLHLAKTQKNKAKSPKNQKNIWLHKGEVLYLPTNMVRQEREKFFFLLLKTASLFAFSSYAFFEKQGAYSGVGRSGKTLVPATQPTEFLTENQP